MSSAVKHGHSKAGPGGARARRSKGTPCKGRERRMSVRDAGALDVREPTKWRECFFCKEFRKVQEFYSAQKCLPCQDRHTAQRKARTGITHEELDKKRSVAVYRDVCFRELYRQDIKSGEVLTDRREAVLPYLKEGLMQM